MELIRDQGFREQRSEYGSRVGGGDSLDVSIYSKLFELHYRPGDEVSSSVFKFGFVFSYHSGSRPPVCSRNSDWQKWRDDQENTE